MGLSRDDEAIGSRGLSIQSSGLQGMFLEGRWRIKATGVIFTGRPTRVFLGSGNLPTYYRDNDEIEEA